MVKSEDGAAKPQRNRGFEETHRALIATAIRLISEKGADALSISALARETGINRTTVYYHFGNRDSLLQAVTHSAWQEIATGLDTQVSRPERIGHIARFVIENPELIKLWIEDFISSDDIHDCCADWDAFVDIVRDLFAKARPDEDIDVEVFCSMILAGAIIGPRVYANSIRPDDPKETIVARFLKEIQRMLRNEGLIR